MRSTRSSEFALSFDDLNRSGEDTELPLLMRHGFERNSRDIREALRANEWVAIVGPDPTLSADRRSPVEGISRPGPEIGRLGSAHGQPCHSRKGSQRPGRLDPDTRSRRESERCQQSLVTHR